MGGLVGEEEEENMMKDQRTSGVLLGQKDRWGRCMGEEGTKGD